MAGLTGLEPATSGVTGQRCNQLYYNPAKERLVIFNFGHLVKQNKRVSINLHASILSIALGFLTSRPLRSDSLIISSNYLAA